ncbi:MAG: LacI family DNA-binding transcriptional regulator [Planctomycetota bacterium]
MSVPRRVTIEQIAVALGLSKSTVSMALREHPRIGCETRERVRRQADVMGYRPHPYVQALMHQVHGGRPAPAPLIAAIDVDGHAAVSGMVQALVQGAREHALRIGYRLEHRAVTSDPGDAVALHDWLQERGILGILLLPMRLSSQLILPWQQYACVMIGRAHPTMIMHRINPDHYANMQLLLEHLPDCGIQRPALVVPSEAEERLQRRRIAAFLASDYRPPRCHIHQFGSDRSLLRWFDRHRPDGLITVAGSHVRGLLAGRLASERIFDSSLKPGARGSGLDPRYDTIASVAIDQLAGLLARNDIGPPLVPVHLDVAGRWRT